MSPPPPKPPEGSTTVHTLRAKDMELRDWYAGVVMQGMASSVYWAENFNYHEKADHLGTAVKVALATADRMMEERSANRKT
jgi:hypothetical protein